MERRTTPEILLKSLELDGRHVADIGCGNGSIARAMAAAGATVVGIDVKQSAIETARAEPAVNGETFLLASAEHMPFADGSQDFVVFHNSMHHVAIDAQETAVAEAARVLVPGGAIYFSEPIARGPRFEVGRLLDDETKERAHAIDAINGAGRLGLAQESEFEFIHERSFADFQAFHDNVVSSDQRRRAFAQHEDEVRAAFDRLAIQRDGRFIFDQPMRINLLRKPG